MAPMLDNLREAVSPELISALAEKTGESESAVSSGVSAAIPTIATAIANRSDDHALMKDLALLATRTSIAPDPSSAAAGGGNLLSTLFAPDFSAVRGGIARHAGISESSAATILAACTPLVLGYLGRLKRDEDLTVSDLADRMRDERADFASAVPPGIEPATTAVGARGGTFRSGAPVAVAVAGLLAAVGLAGAILWAGRKPVQHARAEVTEPMFSPVGTSGSFFAPFTRRLPGNVTITFPYGSAEDRISMYLASAVGGTTSVNCDRIGFQKGSATLTPQSREQLENIATILRAYPRSKITITGHTDNAGNEDANLLLSKARAEAVADSLIAAGISEDRIRAEGYGSRRPVADNATEAGRLQNRRVMLDVSVR